MSLWEILQIRDFCTTSSGGTPLRERGDRYYGGSIPWVKSGELRESIITCTEERITHEALAESSAKLVPAGALLIAMYGATVGRVGLLGIDAATNQAVCSVIPDPKRADSRYLLHWLQAQAPNFVAKGVGGAQPNISQEIIRTTKVPLPPLEEQRRIAAILDQAEALRAKRRQALVKLGTLTQSLFLEVFGDPFANTANWPVLQLGEISEFENGDRSDKYPSGDDIVEEGIVFLNGRNIIEDELDLTSCVFITRSKFASLLRGKARNEDLIITLRGTLGSCCVFRETNGPAFINAQMMIIRTGSKLIPEFLHAALTTRAYKAKFQRMSTGVAVPQLTSAQLRECPVIVPSISAQEEFLAKARAIAAVKSDTVQQQRKIASLSASLQHRAFGGEL